MSDPRDASPAPTRLASLPGTRRLVVSAAVFVSVIILGVVGFVTTQDATVGDALYFTIITVFAVGFAEIIPLDGAGRALTTVLILLGVGSFTFFTLTIIEFLVEGHLLDLLGRRQMERDLAALEDHMIICGFGRVGRQCADDLTEHGAAQVIIDRAESRIAMATTRGLPHVTGDATEEHVLAAAGIDRAYGLAACTDDDAENVLIALTAKLMRPELFIVVRLKNARNASKAHQAGADRVIAPAEIGGHRVAALLTRPAVVDFLDVVTHASDVDLVLEELELSAGSPLVGQTLASAGLRDTYGANVVAIRRAGRDRTTTRPDPDLPLAAGDTLVVIGSQEDLGRLQRQLR